MLRGRAHRLTGRSEARGEFTGKSEHHIAQIRRKSLLALSACVVGVCGLKESRAFAAPISWSAAATSTAWATGSNWVGGTPPTNDLVTDTAVFDLTTYTFQPNAGTTSVSGIQVGDGTTATAALTVSGTALSLGSNGIFDFNNSGPATVSATSVKLGASQSWTNDSANFLNISSGITNVGNITPFILTLNGYGTGGTNLTGIISDGGTTGTTSLVVDTIGGITKLSGVNTFTGPVTISSGGTLSVGAATNLGASTTTTASNLLFDGGTLLVNSGFTLGRNFAMTANGATINSSSSLNASSSSLTDTATTGSQTFTLTGTASSSEYGGTNTTAGGTINLNKSGAGTWQLDKVNTYGTTTLSGGTLKLNIAGALGGTGPINVTNNATISFTTGTQDLSAGNRLNVTAGSTLLVDLNNQSQAFAGIISGGGVFGVTNTSVNGGGTITLNAANTYSGGTLVTTTNGKRSSLAVGSTGTLGANLISNSIVVNGGGQLILAAAGNVGTNQKITLNTGVTLTGFYGVGPVTADLLLSGDFLPAISTASTPNGVIALNSSSFTQTTVLSGSGNGDLFLGSALATAAYTGTSLAVGAGNTYRLGGGGSTLTINGSVLANATAGAKVVVGSGDLEYGLLSNGAAPSTPDTGTVNLGGNNAYSGGTTIGTINNTGYVVNITSGTANTPLGTGAVNVYGTLTASGANGSFENAGSTANTNTVNLVGTAPSLTFDNTGTNKADRWNDATGIALPNGTLSLLGNASTATSETVGALTFSGVSTVAVTRGASTIADTLTTAGLTQSGSGILLIKPSTTDLGTVEFLKTTGTTPTLTTMDGSGTAIAPTYFADSTNKTFVTYGTNGFADIAYTTSSATALQGATSGTASLDQTAALGLTGPSTAYVARIAGNISSSVAGTQRTLNLQGGAIVVNAAVAITDTNLSFTASGGVTPAPGIIYAFSTPTFGSGGSTTGTSVINASSLLIDGSAIFNPSTTGGSVFTGPLTVDNGTLTLDRVAALGSGSTVTLRNSTLNLNDQSSSQSYSNITSTTIVDGGTVTFNEGNNFVTKTLGALALNSSSGTSGVVANFSATGGVDGGSITFGAVMLNDNTLVQVTDAGLGSTGGGAYGIVTFGSLGTSAKTLTKSGTGRLVINSNNSATFSGAVNIIQGVLQVTNLNSLGASGDAPPTVNPGAVLEINVPSYYGTTLTGNGSEMSGSAERWANASARLDGTNLSYTLPAGVTLQLASVTVNPASPSTLTLNGGSIEAWSPEDNNPFAGSTLGANVGITLASNSNIGRTGIDNSGAPSSPLTINGVIASGVNVFGLTKIGSDTDVLAGHNTYLGATTISAGTLQNGISNALPDTGLIVKQGTYNLSTFNQAVASLSDGGVSGTNVVTNSGTANVVLTIDGTATATFSGAITGPVTLTRSNTGTEVLTGINTYTGGTNINGGIINAAGNSNLGIGTVAFGGGTLQFAAAFDPTASSRAVTLNTGGGTFDTNNFNPVITGSMTGVGGLTKVGLGTLTLSGVNTYGGSTTVSNGTLANGVVNALPDTALIVKQATYNLGGLSQRVASLSDGGVTGSNIVTNSSGTAAVLTIDGTGATTFSGVISGSALSLTKANIGTQTLTGTANTYAGATTITGGSLVAGATNSLSPNSVFNVTGGTLDVSGFSQSINSLNLGSAGTLVLGLNSLLAAPGTGTVTLGTGAAVTVSGTTSPSTVGIYHLINANGGLTENAIPVNPDPTNYAFVTGVNTLDLQHRAVIGTVSSTLGSSTPAGSIITGGSLPYTVTASNTAVAGSSNLEFNAYPADANSSGSVYGPVTVAPGATSVPQAGLSFSGTTVGPAQTSTFTINDINATNTGQTGTVTVNVFGHASGSLSTSTLTLPSVIVGYSSPVVSSNSLTVNNAAGYTANLKTTGTLTSNLVTLSGNVAGVTPGNSSSPITASLATGQGVGAVSEGLSLTYADDSTLSGASANLGTDGITVVGNVLDHSHPAIDAAGDTTLPSTITLPSVVVGGSAPSGSVSIYDQLGSYLASQTAGLSVTGTNGSNTSFTLGSVPGSATPIAAGTSGSLGFALASTASVGTYTETFTLNTSDDTSIVGAAAQSNLMFTVSETVITGGPATLTWDNAGGSPSDGVSWDTGINQNFNNGSGASVFNTGDNVTFNDVNNGHYAVTVVGTVTPGSTTFNNSGNYTVSGSNASSGIAGSGSLTKAGSGTVTLSGSNTYRGGTVVNAGTLTLASATAFPANTSLNIASGATVTIANHGTNPDYIPLASVLTNTGTIDITNNGLVIHNGEIGTINSEIQQAYSNGTWTGTSSSGGVITSSTAAGDTSFLTAVGVATGLTSFEGSPVASTDVLVKYTYYGDANLDGGVDGSDYTLIDAAFNNNQMVMAGGSGSLMTGWKNGDFNYDNVIDGSDYTLIDNAFNSQGGNIAAEVAGQYASATAQIAVANGTAAVPEPTTLGLLGIGALGLLRRRTRRHR